MTEEAFGWETLNHCGGKEDDRGEVERVGAGDGMAQLPPNLCLHWMSFGS